MKLIVEIEREDDGRWLAEIGELPGVLAYGVSEAEATAKAQALALRVIADRLEHGEFSQLSSESGGRSNAKQALHAKFSASRVHPTTFSHFTTEKKSGQRCWSVFQITPA